MTSQQIDAMDVSVTTDSTANMVDVRALLEDPSSFGTAEIQQIAAALASGQIGEVRQCLAVLEARAASDDSSKTALLALGVVSGLVGRHETANRYLSQVSGDGIAELYRASALLALDRYDEAADAFENAAKLGDDPVHCTLCRAGAIRLTGQIDAAEQLLRQTAREGATRAEYSYQMGCILADRGDTFGAIEYFERAVDMDPHHTGALFRLAAVTDLLGDEPAAVKLYEQALSKPPFHLGALLNLGLLYEDGEDYSAAAFCFRRILSVDPNHERAGLYLKDIEAAGDMYYDEEADRRERELRQVMATPITDFELSARSRNCLERAGIGTLGDLTKTTEQDLLAGKNFGETSLDEIRAILETRGLRIGQDVEQPVQSTRAFEFDTLSPQERAVIDSPVTDLNLSVRARKCLSRLGITTIGELLSRSADELMAVRNFGVTSLNEIRAALTERDLQLRND